MGQKPPAQQLSPIPRASQVHTGDIVGVKLNGYRGIWYFCNPSDDKYRYKYSGGLGTYCAKHTPLSYYCPKVNRTYFVYGGSFKEKNSLVHMISYYDHATGKVPRPTAVLDKETGDAHDNPVLLVDKEGYLWVFSSSHGTHRPSFLFRSIEPHSIDRFECLWVTNFSYPQPWNYILPTGEKGVCFLHTRYSRKGRRFTYAQTWTTKEMATNLGVEWDSAHVQPIAAIQKGHYQISSVFHNKITGFSKIGTVFNYHPKKGGLDHRTNLYYLESYDGGRTWVSVSGKPIKLPLKKVKNSALVVDFQQRGELAYLKDITFDAEGFPVVLIVRAKNYRSGPQEYHRTWTTIQWTGREWQIQPEIMVKSGTIDDAKEMNKSTDYITSDSNYDTGCLHIEDSGDWLLYAPTDPGPRLYNPGGEMVKWTSQDAGKSWQKGVNLTTRSENNHSYARKPVNAHPDFYALWADGDPREESLSSLYFCDRSGSRVSQLPMHMKSEYEEPGSL